MIWEAIVRILMRGQHYSNSLVLVLKYLDDIVRINVAPKAVQKASKESVEAHILGVNTAQQFSIHARMKKLATRQRCQSQRN